MSAPWLSWLGLISGLGLGLRLHWRLHPRPFPRQGADLLQSRLRLRYLQPDALLDRFGIAPDMTILELGCGTGIMTQALAQRLGDAGQVLALDIQEDLLDRARHRIQEAGLEGRVRFHLADPHAAPLAHHTTDLIVLGSVLGEIPELHACLTRLFEIAKPRSRLVVFDESLNPAFLAAGAAQMHLHAAGFRLGGQIRQWTHYAAVYYKDEVAFDPNVKVGRV